MITREEQRLLQSRDRSAHWKRWGPYLSERAWGTVREDYSPGGTAWDYVPHDHARSRAYRWNEDGIAGISDRHQKLCFALALWNRRDPILKERIFGLTGQEGNHGEDVKELYYYLDSTPTHSYMKYLYKYPQAEFPYLQLVEENRRSGRAGREYELIDTGVFDQHRIWEGSPELLFCDNDTNAQRLFGVAGPRYPRDGINDYLIHGAQTVNPDRVATKCAARYELTIPARASAVVRLRLWRGSRT